MGRISKKKILTDPEHCSSHSFSLRTFVPSYDRASVLAFLIEINHPKDDLSVLKSFLFPSTEYPTGYGPVMSIANRWPDMFTPFCYYWKLRPLTALNFSFIVAGQ
jgi:hypothetical protein